MELNERNWEERGLRDAVLAGDETAWRALYDRCFHPLYAYVYRQTHGHAQRTEDVVQECWLVAVRRIRTFDPDRARFMTWMRGIAENVLRNHRRKWRRRDGAERLTDDIEHAAPATPHGAQVAVAEQVALAIAALPPRYREALRAKYEERLTVAQMAGRSGESVKAVESLLTRARAEFRKAYRKLDE
ncbi:MAG TPA: sigma-70 family RNA polymerase sigma factor [Candidatus Hydrogenedentes bacterium]|nr:sigma-70 family RNA polymerase sigma factor [Candidatus Hydrogenedentota bacterium]